MSAMYMAAMMGFTKMVSGCVAGDQGLPLGIKNLTGHPSRMPGTMLLMTSGSTLSVQGESMHTKEPVFVSQAKGLTAFQMGQHADDQRRL